MAGDGLFNVHTFDVYEGSAKLGRIWKTYENRGDVISIDNDRMSNGRQRGSSTNTQDLKKAFKLITKNFHGPTVAEAVAETLGKANTVVSMLSTKHRREFDYKYQHLSNFLEDYTMNNWEHIKQLAIDAGVSPMTLDGMAEAYEAKLATHEIANAVTNGSGATVMLRGDEYIVVINGVTSIFDTDHLPSHIKRSLGILKMVENHTYVEGHGARVDKDKFFISAKEGAAS
jgi:transcriptional regulator of heat shock response